MEICRQGKAKSWRVSNFSIKGLEKLLRHVSPDVLLAVNQVEAHPWFLNAELVGYCKARGIVVQDFSPLGDGRARVGGGFVGDSAVMEMAGKRGCVVGLLLWSWAVLRGTVPLGRSSMRERVASNFAVVRLSDEEIHALDALDRGEKCRTVDLDWGGEIFFKDHYLQYTCDRPDLELYLEDIQSSRIAICKSL